MSEVACSSCLLFRPKQSFLENEKAWQRQNGGQAVKSRYRFIAIFQFVFPRDHIPVISKFLAANNGFAVVDCFFHNNER